MITKTTGNKSSVKYLGLVMDQDLSGDSTGTNSIKKINSGLKFLYRKGYLFNTREKKMLCSTLLQPFFDYACISWYWGLKANFKHRLQTAQNKMVRYTLSLDARDHVGADHLVRLKWMDVPSRVKFLSLNLLYKISQSQAPEYFYDLQLSKSSRSINTRQSQLSYILPMVGSQGKNSFIYNSVKLWNGLPYEIKISKSKDSFKKACKKLFWDQMVAKEASEYVF